MTSSTHPGNLIYSSVAWKKLRGGKLWLQTLSKQRKNFNAITDTNFLAPKPAALGRGNNRTKQILVLVLVCLCQIFMKNHLWKYISKSSKHAFFLLRFFVLFVHIIFLKAQYRLTTNICMILYDFAFFVCSAFSVKIFVSMYGTVEIKETKV